MKLWLIYTGIFFLTLVIVLTLINASQSPEALIIGDWKELEWEYEKVNKLDENNHEFFSQASDLKKIIGQHLMIHEAEEWKFEPNGKLILQGNSDVKVVHWSIKGRGNILQLKYEDNVVENYNMTRLSENKMVLHFESEIQARGIAKLTFSKIN